MFKIRNATEKLHLKFCKRIMGVHPKSTNLAVYAELGRTPLILQVYTMMVKFWLRINDQSFNDTLVGVSKKCLYSHELTTSSFNNTFVRTM